MTSPRPSTLRRPRLERDDVRLLQPQLRVVLDGDDPLARRHRGRERVEQRRLAGAGAAGDHDVELRAHERAQQRLGRAVERAEPDELLEREQAREAADRDRRAVQRERRDDHVDALAARQPRVDHRARLVDAPVDLRDDPVDRLVELRLVAEADVGALQPAVALDEDLVGPVDHDLRHGRVGEQRLEHAEPDRLVDHLADQPRALGGREHRPLAADHAADDALQPRAPLRLRQRRELGEVDLLEQPPAVVRDAVAAGRRRRCARWRCGRAGPCQLGSVASRVIEKPSAVSPGRMIGIASVTVAVSPSSRKSWKPPRSGRGDALRAAFSGSPSARAATRLAVRVAFVAWFDRPGGEHQLPDGHGGEQQPEHHPHELGRRLAALRRARAAASTSAPA